MDKTLFLPYTIEPEEIDNINEIIHTLLFAQSEDNINLIINCEGGNVELGLAIINAMLATKANLTTINIGAAYSMGFVIFIHGHQRKAFENSIFMTHAMSWSPGPGYTTTKAIKREIKTIDQIDDIMNNMIINKTKITKENIEAMDVDVYYNPKEAIEYGIADEIINADNPLDLEEELTVLEDSEIEDSEITPVSLEPIKEVQAIYPRPGFNLSITL